MSRRRDETSTHPSAELGSFATTALALELLLRPPPLPPMSPLSPLSPVPPLPPLPQLLPRLPLPPPLALASDGAAGVRAVTPSPAADAANAPPPSPLVEALSPLAETESMGVEVMPPLGVLPGGGGRSSSGGTGPGRPWKAVEALSLFVTATLALTRTTLPPNSRARKPPQPPLTAWCGVVDNDVIPPLSPRCSASPSPAPCSHVLVLSSSRSWKPRDGERGGVWWASSVSCICERIRATGRNAPARGADGEIHALLRRDPFSRTSYERCCSRWVAETWGRLCPSDTLAARNVTPPSVPIVKALNKFRSEDVSSGGSSSAWEEADSCLEYDSGSSCSTPAGDVATKIGDFCDLGPIALRIMCVAGRRWSIAYVVASSPLEKRASLSFAFVRTNHRNYIFKILETKRECSIGTWPQMRKNTRVIYTIDIRE